MSRGFVKESDQEEMPVIPPRAPLPPEETNYVTAYGMELLQKEKEQLEQEKAAIPATDEDQKRRETIVLNSKLRQLQERIDSAQVVEPPKASQKEIRFGATVSYRMLNNNKKNTFQIVGVDEADVKKKKIAFIAPIAKALMGHQAGEEVEFQLGNEKRKLEILEVKY